MTGALKSIVAASLEQGRMDPCQAMTQLDMEQGKVGELFNLGDVDGQKKLVNKLLI